MDKTIINSPKNFKKVQKKIIQTFKRTSDLSILKCVSESLANLIPVLLLSTFVIVLIEFPYTPYQNFIKYFYNGKLLTMFNYIHSGTFGMLSVYMTIAVADTINRHIGKISHRLPVIVVSLASFFIFSGAFNTPVFNPEMLGPKNTFTAILCAIISSSIYLHICNKLVFNNAHYVDGISTDFSSIITSLIPMVLIFELFACANLFLTSMGYVSFYALFTNWLNKIFSNMQQSVFSLIRFELLQNILWTFGIHGSDALSETKYQIFDTALTINKQLVAGGKEPTIILTGVFIDVFVLLGGCGSTWSLVLAIIFFSKQRNDKYLARISSIPMLFNINELVLLGLPVVFNPVFVIPFLLVPVVNILIAYTAMATGLVPMTYNDVNWTTPILIGGYLATGSIRGSILQIVNVLIGILIYAPFVKINDRLKLIRAHEKVKSLENILKESEESREPIDLLSLPGDSGRMARTLAAELASYIDEDNITLFYQPQFNDKHKLIGAESLLRWKHDQYGLIYPPLVIALAEESGKLFDLEKKVFLKSVKDLDELIKYKEDESFHLSINVTGITIQKNEFEDFLVQLDKDNPGKSNNILIEITEQATLKVDDTFIARLQRIKALGFSFGIDDFSMGNTSIKYLQSNVFNIVKLDGGISRDIFNDRSREIISSISRLTEELGIGTVAEYVETEEQRKALEAVGCHIYQGYLYSPAIPLNKFAEFGTVNTDEYK